jgi:SAM-dependent methyltransferase
LERLTLVEIGLKRIDDQRRASNSAEGSSDLKVDTAPSLRMWRTYFPNAKLIGFDIDDFSSVSIQNCVIVQGDSSAPEDLRQISQVAEGKIDIIIDDASHASHHQQLAIAELYDTLAPGGIYVVEDLHWQPRALERPNTPRTRDIARRWQCGLTLPSLYLSEQDQRRILSQIAKLELFDSHSRVFDDPADALLILHKRR